MSILAIDLGQSKSVYAFRGLDGKEQFGGFSTTDAQLRKLLACCAPRQVVVEVCPLAAKVHDIARELGIAVVVADTTQDAWAWRNVKRKTDRDDALKLLRLALVGQLNPVHVPSPLMRQWRTLIQSREAAVVAQTRCKVRLRALLLRSDQALPRSKSGWTQEALRELRAQSRPLKECPAEELWRGILALELDQLELLQKQMEDYERKLDEWAGSDQRLRLVSSIPGVGTVTAAAIVAALDNPRRFRTRRQVAAYAGLTPRRFQSGQMDRQGRISKRGYPVLRRILNQAAWAAVRYDRQQRGFYLRLSDHGARGKRKRAIVAVMHKLLVVAWAVLRDQRPWEPRCDGAPARPGPCPAAAQTLPGAA
jgi:transposase